MTPGFSFPTFLPSTSGRMVVISWITEMFWMSVFFSIFFYLFFFIDVSLEFLATIISADSPLKTTNGLWGHHRSISYITLSLPSLENKQKMAHLHWLWGYLSCRTLPTLFTNPFPKLITGSRYSIVLPSLGRNSTANTNNITASVLL